MVMSGQKVLKINADKFHFRSRRCDDCGFTKGTEANKSGVTAIKAQLCAEIPTPFLCHFNAKGNEIPNGKETLCEGWVEECNRLSAEGYYERQPEWLRDHKMAITDIIVEIENEGVSDPVGYFQRRMLGIVCQLKRDDYE